MAQGCDEEGARHGRLVVHHAASLTPPGYDPHRAKPYPTLCLSPGYGGNEVVWRILLRDFLTRVAFVRSGGPHLS